MTSNSVQKTYLFYDLETSGLNQTFDQVLQFAAVRTDECFNEIDRYEIFVRLLPDIIPSPAAVMTHGIMPQHMQNAVSEYDGICQIHQLLNTPGTISLGYNTLGFDDPFLRFSFYRNLKEPYTHQYNNSCSRMDIYPFIPWFFLFSKNSGLKWPVVDGKVSLRLEHLGKENQLMDGEAHNAMVDVLATVALAKKLSAHKGLWDRAASFFTKDDFHKNFSKLDNELICNDKSYKEAVLIQGIFGSERNYMAPALYIGNSTHYTNQFLWMRLDGNLDLITKENHLEHVFVYRMKRNEGDIFLKPQPVTDEKMGPERLAQIEKNKQWIEKNPDIFEHIVQYHLDFKYPFIPNIDCDASLYQDGFDIFKNISIYRRFHAMTWEKKYAFIDQLHPKIQPHAKRLVARHAKELLCAQDVAEYDAYLKSIFSVNTDEQDMPVNYKGQKKLTAAKALEEIEKLLHENKSNLLQIENLKTLKEFIIK